MSDGLSFNLEAFLGDIEGAKLGLDAAAAVVRSSMTSAIDAITRDMISQAQINLETHTRSGDLSRSAVILEAQVTDDAISQVSGFTERYAAQVDQGGYIFPKNGRALAIPLEPVLTGAGVARYAGPLEDDGAPNGLFIVKLFGKVFLAQHVGEGADARLEFRWLLVPSVLQPGTDFYTSVIQERQSQVGAVAAQLVKDDLGRAA